MELEVDGINNQVAGRDFYQINNAHGRLLTKDERKELNDRVQALAEQYDERPWDTWRTIHRAIGVGGINELHLEHRDQVQFILDLLEDRCKLKHQLERSAIPAPTPSDRPSTLENRISRGGIITWVTEFPEYAGLLFMIGIATGTALWMI